LVKCKNKEDLYTYMSHHLDINLCSKTFHFSIFFICCTI